ncbi:glycosylphosphatidylinositol-anchored merozoite surface protein, partial [Babesia divergens]
MNTTKFLNTAAVCLLAMGFNGQSVICNDTVAKSAVTSPTTADQPSKTVTEEGSPAPQPPVEPEQVTDKSAVQIVGKSLELVLKELKGQRETFLSKITESSGSFTILQLVDFLRIVDGNLLLKVEQGKIDEVGVKVKAYLDSIGIKGQNVEESLGNLMVKVYQNKGASNDATQGDGNGDNEQLNTLLKAFAKELKAEIERQGEKKDNQTLLANLNAQNEEFAKKFNTVSPSFLTSQEISAFLTVPEYGASTDHSRWKTVEKKINEKVGQTDATRELLIVIGELIEQREHIMDLIYGPIGNHGVPSESSQGSSPKKPSFASVPSSL